MQLIIQGDKEMVQKLKAFAKEFPDKIGKSIYKRAEKVMTVSKREYVPVDLGILRGTGHVDPPEISGGNVSVQLSYGGPAAPYATEQHENERYIHEHGEWKYLEKPLMAAARTMANDIARDLKL